MTFLLSVVAAEVFAVLSIVMYIDGRRPTPSIFIRNHYLFGIVAMCIVSLLVFSFGAFIATLLRWYESGVQFPQFAGITVSVVVTFVAYRFLAPRMWAAHAVEQANLSASGAAAADASVVRPALPAAA